MVDLALPKKTK